MKWIKVEDGLPKEDGEYIVNTTYNGKPQPVFTLYWVGYSNKWEDVCDHMTLDKFTQVTHWMHLPEKPNT